jgi:hypothetical protein
VLALEGGERLRSREVADLRPVTRAKSAGSTPNSVEDVAQAAHVLFPLEELRPGDPRIALSNAEGRGKGWRAALDRGVELLRRVDANAAAIVVAATGA